MTCGSCIAEGFNSGKSLISKCVQDYQDGAAVAGKMAHTLRFREPEGASPGSEFACYYSIPIGNSDSQSFLEWTTQAKRRFKSNSLDTPFFIFN